MKKELGGLRFECQPGCSKCCEVEGWVYLTEDDVVKAAKYVGMTPADFEAKYLYRTKRTIRFRRPGGGRQCHFLINGTCSIHEAKPTQCWTFPFWPELVENRKEWKKAGKACPGIDKGPLVQIGTALEISEKMRQAYPTMYMSFSGKPGAREYGWTFALSAGSDILDES